MKRLDTSFARAVPALLPLWNNANIALIGCGSVGSWLAPSIVRLAKAVEQRLPGQAVNISLIDPARVDRRDLVRRNFCEADVDRPKAEALAERYGAAWGMEITAIPRPFQSEQLRHNSGCNNVSIGVVCTKDEQALAESDKFSAWQHYNFDTGAARLWQLDCHRLGDQGRVILGSCQAPKEALRRAFSMPTFCKILPPVPSLPSASHDLPDSSPLKEARALVEGQIVAAEAADYLLRLITATLRRFETRLDLSDGRAVSRYVTPEAVLKGRQPRQSADPEQRRAVPLPPLSGNARFVVVGCGGTGSWLLPGLARIAQATRESGQNVEILCVDPDHVEEANITRQNFCEAEIGLPKAETLARRMSPIFGGAIKAITARFEPEMIADFRGESLVLIGCVDNYLARRQLERALSVFGRGQSAPAVWWLDCGNGRDNGQVLIGSATQVEQLKAAFRAPGRCAILPAPSLQHPELLQPGRGNEPRRVSCEHLLLASAQSLMVNQRTAATAAGMLFRLAEGSLNIYAAYFDLPSGTAHPRFISRNNVAAAVGMDPRCLR